MNRSMVVTAILAIATLLAACAAPAAVQVASPAVTNQEITDWSKVGDEMLLIDATGYGYWAGTTAPATIGDWSRIGDEMLLLGQW